MVARRWKEEDEEVVGCGGDKRARTGGSDRR